MTKPLDGKVAVVTGAGRGVGRAYSLALAAAGASVVVNDLPAEGGASSAESVVADVRNEGGEAIASHGSVADPKAAEAIVGSALSAYGGLDILIANAGIMRPAYISEARPGDWSDLMDVHANGTFNSVHHATAAMVERGGGTVVTTGDIAMDLYFPRLAAYRAAKAAIAVLTVYAAEEFRAQNINVNSVMPGATDTAMARKYFDSLGEVRNDFVAAVGRRHAEDDDADGGGLSDASTVPPLGVFLCTDAGKSITGQLFQMRGTTIRCVTPENDVSMLRPAGAAWTMEELADAVPDWLRKRRVP